MPDKKEAPANSKDEKRKSPEEEASERIAKLQVDVVAVEREIKTLEGKLANRNPAALGEVRTANAALEKRLTALKLALYSLLIDSLKPRFNEDLHLQLECLRQATIEFCQKANVDPEIWKNIAS
jgi:hypothetical protein